MKLQDLSNKLSDILEIGRFVGCDSSLNGLQVGDVNLDVKKVAFAVDASLNTINKAVEQGANLLFVHHGLFWGRPLAITGRHYNRVSTLIKNNVGLFACHLPLDAHLTYGNNAQMARALGMKDVQEFSVYKGVSVGVKGVLPHPMTADEIVQALGIRRNSTNFVVNAGSDGQRRFCSAGIVSGEGASDIYQAMADGLDVLITGEGRYSTLNDCLETTVGMLCLGHYETETFGVKAVMGLISQEFGLETCFIDAPLGL